MTADIKAKFSVYRDEDERLFIVDDNERVILADVFAYDSGLNDVDRKISASNRMEDIVHAMNIGWDNK
jgi:hypothetical protein